MIATNMKQDAKIVIENAIKNDRFLKVWAIHCASQLNLNKRKFEQNWANIDLVVGISGRNSSERIITLLGGALAFLLNAGAFLVLSE